MSETARRSARERLREKQRRQVERARRRRSLLVILSPVAVILLVVAAGVAVQALRDRGSEFEGGLPQATVLEDGSVRFAAEGTNKSTPVIDVYEDFQCPACKEFERINGGTLKKFASDKTAVVAYHPVAIIDQRSVRAGSAAQCAADAGSFMAYHDVLFESQPPERGGQGFTADDLMKYGAQVGLDGDKFTECVESVKYREDILQRTERISEKYQRQTGKGFGTPTVYLNGKSVDVNVLFSADAFEDAVKDATEPAPQGAGRPNESPEVKK